MPEIEDDKSRPCISFILSRLKVHRQTYPEAEGAPPLFVGLNGVQGAGKSTLVSIIKETLEAPPFHLPTVVFSLDDLYLTHADQLNLASRFPGNSLLQHRGQPSTHDILLAKSIFSSLSNNSPTAIPRYNKAAFSGQGDRCPEDQWDKVNVQGQRIVRVVVFEGWSVGFRPLGEPLLKLKWQQALMARETGHYLGRLGHVPLESVAQINSVLREYDPITDQLDALIHIDVLDLQYVYTWRMEQEANLRGSGGSGMTDDQVRNFVDGYYPAYELFTETLRSGIFGIHKDRQLRLVLDKDRKVREVFMF